MENTTANLQQNLSKGFQLLADLSMATLKSTMDNSLKSTESFNKVIGDMGIQTLKMPTIFGGTANKDCCAPQDECPPHCILQIERHAMKGERIVVPFYVKNTCNAQKKYRVGVRELKNADGSMAPSQPQLNKNEVTLNPGEEQIVLMAIDLGNFNSGDVYNTEIVVREKEINQNICFKLLVDGFNNVPVATPQDEKTYKLRWQSWKNHFYCEPPKRDPNG